ncbi:MAG: hypothetical protein ACJ8DJ_12880 [Gemmatimonadales bacterium]
MRPSMRILLCLAVAAAVVALAQSALGSSPQGAQAARAGHSFVTLSAMSEPPDRRNRGTTFSVAFTLANQGSDRSSGKTTVRFYLTKKAGKPRRGDVRLKGSASIGGLSSKQDNSRRIRVRIPTRTPLRLWFLVACTKTSSASGARSEHNRCRVSGQRVRILPRHGVGPAATPLSLPLEFRIDRFTLPIGRPTICSAGTPPSDCRGINNRFGDAERSTQRREFVHAGGIRMVADCKRTTNGDSAGPDAPFTNPGDFDEDGDEAKILIYGDEGTITTFSSMGNSARKNIPPGEGSTTPPRDTNGVRNQESIGGEGKHMAIAAARDPQQASPENDWVTAYKIGTIYITTNKGTEMIFTGYAAIDTLGIGDNCGFGGLLKVVKI